MIHRDPVTAFCNSMADVFGPLDFNVIPDGGIHRFRVPDDKTGTRNGWYVLHLDGLPCGAFGSWKAGDSHTWRHREPVNRAEAEQCRQRQEQARRKREAEQEQRQRQVAERALRLWNSARPANPNHPYLSAKRVKPHGLCHVHDTLLVPLLLADDVVNVQRIGPDGQKRFLLGGRVKGCYSPLGDIEDGKPLYVCEGWATGATLHEATGAAVACAMNAGNLLDVGRTLQRQHPDALLIIAGDDDRQTPGNPGRTAAIKAASTLCCGLVFPPWDGSEPEHLSDFNDLANWRAGA